MSKARDPIEVIDAVLKHVPANLIELRAKLLEIQEDSFFRPPEGKRPTWILLRDTLQAFLSMPPRQDWEIKISDIVEGRADLYLENGCTQKHLSDSIAKSHEPI